MKFRVNEKKFSKRTVVILVSGTIGVIFSGCHTTLHTSSGQKENSLRILETRNNVPSPYSDPESSTQFGVKPDPEADVSFDKYATLKDNQIETMSESAFLSPKIEKRVIPIENPPVVNSDFSSKTEYLAPTIPEPLPEISDIIPLTYTVQKGDTLWDISKMYGVSVNELVAVNRIKKTDILQPGMVLDIPKGGSLIPIPKRSYEKKASKSKGNKPNKKITKRPIPSSGKYIVQKGDNLWEIGQKFGLAVHSLKELNNLNSNLLHPGQTLVLKEKSAKTSKVVRKDRIYSNTPPPKYTAKSVVERKTETPKTEIDESIFVPNIGDAVSSKEEMSNSALPGNPGVNLKNLPHYVALGDSLESIAEMYGSRVEWILEANSGLKSNSDLDEGREIQVPCPDIR